MGVLLQTNTFFLDKRPPDALNNFFLYASTKAHIGDSILLCKKKNIGINPLGNSTKEHVKVLIAQDLVPVGTHSNISLRKGLVDHLLMAGVASGLADACLGHFTTRKETTKAGFAATALKCACLFFVVQDATHKGKTCPLLSDPRLKWSDVENDKNFHIIFKYICPIKDWVSTSTTKPDKHEQP